VILARLSTRRASPNTEYDTQFDAPAHQKRRVAMGVDCFRGRRGKDPLHLEPRSRWR
jgi:hypothetical protein